MLKGKKRKELRCFILDSYINGTCSFDEYEIILMHTRNLLSVFE